MEERCRTVHRLLQRLVYPFCARDLPNAAGHHHSGCSRRLRQDGQSHPHYSRGSSRCARFAAHPPNGHSTPIGTRSPHGIGSCQQVPDRCLEGKDNVLHGCPRRMSEKELQENLQKLCDVLAELIDGDLIPWVASEGKPSKQELDRAATVIADRMCGASSDPIIRNAQERRQLATLKRWLRETAIRRLALKQAKDPYAMPPGTFTFRLSMPAGNRRSSVKIPIDCVVKPLRRRQPIFRF